MTTRRFLAVAAVAAALLTPAAAAHAHAGHDHGAAEPAPPPPAAAGPGSAGVGDGFEAVLKPAGDTGTLLYLADLDSNAPVAGAVVEIEGGWQGRAQATTTPGVYVLDWALPAQPVDLTLTVAAGGRDDLILLTGVAATVAPPLVAAAAAAAPDWRRWLGAAAAGLAGLLGVVLAARRRGAAATVALLVTMLAAGSALAHAGHDHGGGGGGDEPAAAPAPGRSLTLSKESQFLLGIRTVKAEAREVADTVRLVGRVVPDPAGYARLQPAQAGRIVADPLYPMPMPGQAVTRGDVLAVLEPNLTALERAEQRAALAQLDAQVAQTDRQLKRWLGMGDAARRKDIDDARLDLERLHKQRQQVESTALGRELLRAPLDGLVTDVHVVPGQVIDSSVTAVEIVNPERLRVEAVLHDLGLEGRIAAGTATTRLLRGHAFGLRLIGSGGRIDARDQGLHLIFAVSDGARLLKLGMPVDVHAETGTAALRVAVPREAVSDAGGRPVVFVKTAPERFEMRAVTLGRGLGGVVEVTAGIKPGERVVVQGGLQLLAVR